MKYGVGIYNPGKYLATINGKETSEYATWASIIKRCCHRYSNHLNYNDCSVCDEWLNFQTFAEWYNNNYYSIGNDKMFIDKDLLIPNNTIYKPEACVFVNRQLNNFLTLRQNYRGEYPVGVRHPKTATKNPYQAYISKYGQVIILGSFKTVEEAYDKYCEEKNIYARELAELYKNDIPKNLYDVLNNFDIKNYKITLDK